MGQDPSEIRNDIEATRARMGDTAEALGHKADVPGRAREAISDRVESVKSTISGSTPDTGDVKQGAQRAAGIAKENPLGLAIGATAVGFVAGLLVPSTRVEDDKIGPMADQVKEKAKETGQEALERGKHVAQEAAQTVKEEGRQQAQQMAPSS
jgi:ElaB/YqjD/DUF883 family membrane-anchored ribosome-binding protein